MSAFSIYEYPTGTGLLSVNFEYLRGYVSYAELARFADRIRSLPGVTERLEGLEQADFKKRPALPINQVLGQPGAGETIIEALEELMTAQPEG